MIGKFSTLCLSTTAALLAAVPCAFAQEAATAGGVNQLQMARLPQQAQRAEFPLVGEESAFKFNFFEDVRPGPLVDGLHMHLLRTQFCVCLCFDSYTKAVHHTQATRLCRVDAST